MSDELHSFFVAYAQEQQRSMQAQVIRFIVEARIDAHPRPPYAPPRFAILPVGTRFLYNGVMYQKLDGDAAQNVHEGHEAEGVVRSLPHDTQVQTA